MRDFDHVVFSGGGTRCFWHGGLLSIIGTIDDLAPQRLTAISGGSLSAACWISGRDTRCREVMASHFEDTQKNIRPEQSNTTPHQELYRSVVAETLGDDGIEAVADGPEFSILVSRLPRRFGLRAQAALYAAICQSDQRVRGTPHLVWPRKAGLACMEIDARQAARDGRLVDLICAAATIPPVFDIPRWDSHPIIDGGFYTKAPLPGPDQTLYLLTKPYPDLPEDSASATYLAPTSSVEADKIDFTDAAKIDSTWQQGRLDAGRWIASGKSVAKA